jgi:L-amino acid N-acyltransferase YncA
VRPAREADALELAALLNEIIARGGTTALEELLAPQTFSRMFLSGADVICCFVAVRRSTGSLLGFQSLQKWAGPQGGIGDIGPFARVGHTQRGVGSAHFAATRSEARVRALDAINATIRADNTGGLAFYGRMGFVDHSVQRAVPLRNGTAVDRISKRYDLTVPG